MKRLLITLMLATLGGFAQSRPAQKKQVAAAPPGRWPIESLTVEGNRSYTREQILAAAGLRPGQIAGRQDFEAARDRLVGSGAFETVGYKFTPGPSGGYSAVFQVTEVQQVYPAEFQGLSVSMKDLDAAFRAKEPLFSSGKLPATQPVLERYSRWLEQYLAKLGVNEKITAMVAPSDPGDYAVVFTPARNLPAVAQVNFEGNHVVPSNVLREAVAGAAIGAPYTEDTFRQVLRASVRPVYETRGRLRVSFPKIRTEPATDVAGVNVFVTVDEGQSYQLGKVAIDGPTPIEPAQLLKTGDFKSGDVANMTRVNEGLERMRLALRRAGYLDARATADRAIDDDKRTVDLSIGIDPGTRYTMGKLNITGLDIEGEAEMRRIWTLKEGAPFNADYPDLFLKRVREQGMFDDLGDTKSDVHVNDHAHTVDVNLIFKGTKPRPGHRRGA
jgi:outer membrane protein insertion porin family